MKSKMHTIFLAACIVVTAAVEFLLWYFWMK